MADEIDRANDLAQKELDAAIAAARGVVPTHHRESLPACQWCGCEIPRERREAIAGVQFCKGCQEVVESLRERGLM